MTSDESRLEDMARALGQRLHRRGLLVPEFMPRETADEGWWALVAQWPDEQQQVQDSKRPRISVILDNWLGAPKRRFWFGFESRDQEIIDDLVQEIGSLSADLARYDHASNPDDSRYFRDLNRKGGLALERVDKNEHYFGKYEIGFGASSDKELADQAARFIMEVIEAADPSFAERRDIGEIRTLTNISASERQALISARRGQGKFRADLIRYWGGCAVRGRLITAALRASHIKPWARCIKNERLDPQNGLLLDATLDALFDSGLVTFTDRGAIMISAKLSVSDQKKLRLSDKIRLLKVPLSRQKEYLKVHRESVFRAK